MRATAHCAARPARIGAIFFLRKSASTSSHNPIAGTDKTEPTAEIRFCGNCGATTHFTLTTIAVAKFGNTMMGVNMPLADERNFAGLELRFPDGRTDGRGRERASSGMSGKLA